MAAPNGVFRGEPFQREQRDFFWGGGAWTSNEAVIVPLDQWKGWRWFESSLLVIYSVISNLCIHEVGFWITCHFFFFQINDITVCLFKISYRLRNFSLVKIFALVKICCLLLEKIVCISIKLALFWWHLDLKARYNKKTICRE